MKRGTLRSLLAGAAFAGFSLGAFADVKENTYQVIIERNPFGLKPIPPPPVPVVDTNPPPVEVEIKLTGISNLTGSPKAFIELIETKTKKTERPPPMVVGDKQGDVEILSIDPDNYTVRIRKGGAETTLDFEKNGYKAGAALAGGAPAPHIPGVPPIPVPPQPVPGFPNPNPNSGMVVGGGNPGGAYNPGATLAGNTAVPSRPVRTDNVVAGGGGQGVAPPPPKQLTIDEARQIIELRRQEMERARPGSSIILPPSGLTPPQPEQHQAPNIPAPTPFRRF